MSLGVKRNADFGIGKQTAEGTPVAPSIYLRAVSANIEHSPVEYTPETIGTRQDTVSEDAGNDITWRADLVAETADDYGQLLYWFFGAKSDGAGPPYPHTITPVETFDPDTGFMTVHVDRKVQHDGASTENIRAYDACINNLTVEIAPRTGVKWSVEGIAGATDEAASISGTYDGTPFMWQHMTFLINDYGSAPSSETDIEKVTLNFQNNFDYSRITQGSNQPKAGVAGGFNVTVDIETTMKDDSFIWTRAYNKTMTSMKILLTRVVGTTTFINSFYFPKLRPIGITDPEIGGGNDRPIVGCQFKALEDPDEVGGDTDAVTVVFQDDKATY